MVLHRYTGFFVILPCIPSFAQCVALPFGPGHGCQWSTGRKSFIQDDGTINFNSTKVPFSLWCYEHGEDLQDGGWDRLHVMSPIQVQNGCHLCWPGPCGSLWWDQLTSLGGIIWLVARLENGTLGIWIHPVMPIFLESENSIINYVCRLKWLPCDAFLFYLIITVCYLFI